MFSNIGVGGFVIIAVIVLVLFGRGRVGSFMNEVGSGISSVRRGIRDSGDQKVAAASSPATDSSRRTSAK